ncbi:hypothetical protein O181_083820 [Austropuccinia psidii MF-1]|uniref:Retropepsins domain-containing protein n=1 Tax=Austropuccinia psidii MF-1 TaxID=1389203 RepID=A0A9Q3ILY5_9BASI|nr:hypothetical protein [Austropuccinia psidii MF-1]
MDLIHVQDAKMQQKNPSRGNSSTDGSCCITNIVIKNKANISLDSGAFCTCVGKDYVEKIYTNWKEQSMPIRGIKFSSSTQDMHPLGFLEAEMIFPHPSESIRLKFEFVLINSCNSKHFILGNNYLNSYGIGITNHNDRYFTIGGNKRQKSAFPLKMKEITVNRQVKNANKEKFVSDQLIEARISPELQLLIEENRIKSLFQYREAFASAMNH